jgi:hypothetical protein
MSNTSQQCKEQPTFERCAHDRKNPYVMISREMAQDPSISPSAKGVLLYLLSLPPNWKIYHSQLQDALGVGEDYIRSVMKELLQSGYAERKRERINGSFGPYQYTIREFKKCSPDRENPSGKDNLNCETELPSQPVLNQTGLTGPGKPAIISKDIEKKHEKQQHYAAAENKIFNSQSIEFLTPGRVKKSVTESQIYSYFLDKRFSTQTIQKAIQQVRNKNEPIGNVFRLIETICESIESEYKTYQTKQIPPDNVPLCTAKAVSGSLYTW